MRTQEWLASPDRTYRDGLAIYHRIKRNKKKDNFFNAVPDAAPGSLHFNLLLQEIKNAHRVSGAIGNIEEEIKKPLPTKDITTGKLNLKQRFVLNDIVDVKSLPVDLQEKYFRNQSITREIAGLHQELKAATSDEKRKEVAERISTLFSERTSNWVDLKAYSSPTTDPDKNKGQAEEKATDDPKEVLKAAARLKTVKINISRAQKDLKKNIPEAKKKQRQTKINAWIREQRNLEAYLEKHQ